MAPTNYAADSLKYQWRLYGIVARSEWATSLDKSIAYEIVENYRKDFGNSRASLRYLEHATKATRTNIIASLRRLVEYGPFSVLRLGAGVRPTEYKLHFDMVAENTSGITHDTTSNLNCSGIVHNTSCGLVDETSSSNSGIADNTESVLPVPTYKVDVQDRKIEPSARSAPHAPVLKEAGAAVPVGGFHELWLAYGYRRNKAAAKQAYETLSPDKVLHADIIDAAHAWKEAWEIRGKSDAPRKTLAGWIAAECYDEEPPKAYQKRKRKAANDNRLVSYRRDTFGITVLRQGCAPTKVTDHLQIQNVESEAADLGVKSDDGVFVMVK